MYAECAATARDSAFWSEMTAAVSVSLAEPRRSHPAKSRDATTIEDTLAQPDKEFAIHAARLKAIVKDKTLWPENAEPPNEWATRAASVVLEQLREQMLLPTRVVASGEGGIAICFVRGQKYADIECLNVGTALAVVSNRRDRPIVWEIDPRLGDVARAAVRIRHFLNAP